jgi:hypothetical protein
MSKVLTVSKLFQFLEHLILIFDVGAALPVPNRSAQNEILELSQDSTDLYPPIQKDRD